MADAVNGASAPQQPVREIVIRLLPTGQAAVRENIGDPVLVQNLLLNAALGTLGRLEAKQNKPRIIVPQPIVDRFN